MALKFKFVELSIVTDETIEATVNEWVANGWQLEGIRFVVSDASKRPQMAFVSFTREVGAGATETHPLRTPPVLIDPDDEITSTHG
ncbi:MAG: hypothetical protein AB7P03_13480 [Kofleriaceae bacterium]